MKNWKTTAEAIPHLRLGCTGNRGEKAGTRCANGSAGCGRRTRAGSDLAYRVRDGRYPRDRQRCSLEAIVGAGTVTNVEQLKEVTEAGAQFAISPGPDRNLLAATGEGTIPLIPGISTVSELMLGMQYGLKEFKFFPAEANGGVKALQAIKARSRIFASARLAASLRRTIVIIWR